MKYVMRRGQMRKMLRVKRVSVVVGLLVWRAIPESPVFARLLEVTHARARQPLLDVVRQQPRSVRGNPGARR